MRNAKLPNLKLNFARSQHERLDPIRGGNLFLFIYFFTVHTLRNLILRENNFMIFIVYFHEYAQRMSVELKGGWGRGIRISFQYELFRFQSSLLISILLSMSVEGRKLIEAGRREPSNILFLDFIFYSDCVLEWNVIWWLARIDLAWKCVSEWCGKLAEFVDVPRY